VRVGFHRHDRAPSVRPGRDGVDRTTVKHRQRIAPDRAAAARWRARKRTRDALPKRINETLAKGRELVKAAKGLK
jgi:hypothetical protein